MTNTEMPGSRSSEQYTVEKFKILDLSCLLSIKYNKFSLIFAHLYISLLSSSRFLSLFFKNLQASF
jgi:hypothetical protein